MTKPTFRQMLAGISPVTDGTKVVDLGRSTLENRVANVHGAQRRMIKAIDEVAAARAYIASAQAELKAELDALDTGLEISIIPISDDVIVSAFPETSDA